MSKTAKAFIGLGLCLVLALIGLGLVRWWCFSFVDNYEIAYKYSYWGGGIERVKGAGPDGRGGGYVWAPFWLYGVHTVDMRPMQVCINANQRVLNCKLVQFNPDGIDPATKQRGLELFLSWHGRNNYEGPGNASSGSSNSTETTTFSEILKSYAYEGTGRDISTLRANGGKGSLRKFFYDQPIAVGEVITLHGDNETIQAKVTAIPEGLSPKKRRAPLLRLN
jgi:hypothetical protein